MPFKERSSCKVSISWTFGFWTIAWTIPVTKPTPINGQSDVNGAVTNATIIVMQKNPLPLTILSVSATVAVQDNENG